MKILSDEVYSIVSDAIKEILERTEGHKSAMKYLINEVCLSCIIALTNSKYKRYKKNEKIASIKRQIERCVNDIDQAIEYYSYCVGE